MTDKITQADRDAAADFGLANYMLSQQSHVDLKAGGEWDEWPLVQLVAAHRLAGQRAGMLRAAGIAEVCDMPWSCPTSEQMQSACDMAERIAAAIRAQAGEPS